MEKLKPYLHKVKYYETDQMAVVHHSNYIRWFEDARCDLLEQIGFGYDKMEEEGIMIPVLSVSCDYKKMTLYGETVTILTKIAKFTGVKLIVTYQVIDSNNGEIKATGETSHCFLDPDHNLISIKNKNNEIYDLLKNLINVDISIK